jgi:hypothetical protein
VRPNVRAKLPAEAGGVDRGVRPHLATCHSTLPRLTQLFALLRSIPRVARHLLAAHHRPPHLWRTIPSSLAWQRPLVPTIGIFLFHSFRDLRSFSGTSLLQPSGEPNCHPAASSLPSPSTQGQRLLSIGQQGTDTTRLHSDRSRSTNQPLGPQEPVMQRD